MSERAINTGKVESRSAFNTAPHSFRRYGTVSDRKVQSLAKGCARTREIAIAQRMGDYIELVI